MKKQGVKLGEIPRMIINSSVSRSKAVEKIVTKLSQAKSVEDSLQQIAQALPQAWQYPEYAVARIRFDGKEYLSSDSKFEGNTKWIQSQSFVTHDNKKGSIEIFYLKDFPVEDEGPYLQSERWLINNISNLICQFLSIMQEQEKITPRHKELLGLIAEHIERKKELAAINRTTEILQQGLSLEESLQQICNALPYGWQYPEHTAVRIVFDHEEFSSENFRETRWVQKQDFVSYGNKRGTIEVYYLKKFKTRHEGPFLQEERQLLNNIATLLSGLVVQKGVQKLFAENRERIKELTAINQTTQILETAKNRDEALQRIALMLPQAWQHPEYTAARIWFGKDSYISDDPDFRQSPWALKQEFVTIDNKKGAIEIFYLNEFPPADEGPFLKEERHLINNLASLISGYLNRVRWRKIVEKTKQDEQKQKKQESTVKSRQLLQRFMSKQTIDKNIYFDLMPFKVKEILLVSTLYDAFILENEDRFFEQSMGEVYHLNLSSLPRITGVTSPEEALETLRNRHFDIVILMMGVDKAMPIRLSEQIKEKYPEITVFLLLNNNRDIAIYQEESEKIASIDKVFVWNGDSKIFFAMVKLVEDKTNADNDTQIGMVRVILLIEDSVKYYSRYLPTLYSIVFEQTQQLISEVNRDEMLKIMRMKTRTKVLLASNYEEAILLFNKYKDYLLCVISDVKFKRNGKMDENAGFRFLKYAKKHGNDLPTVLQSSDPENKQRAYSIRSNFINKNSETLIHDLKSFITYYLGFGDFVYRDKDGKEIAVAKSMKEFEFHLKNIPDESLVYHAVKNHFSLWLMARGEISIAKIIHPSRVSDFRNTEDMRQYLIHNIEKHRNENNRGKVVNFDDQSVLDQTNVVSIGTGSLGGKGRGLAFINTLINNLNFFEFIPGIHIRTPLTTIIGSHEFDQFLELNHLKEFLHKETDYDKIRRRFLQSRLSEHLIGKLKRLISQLNKPLAIRSSSLFEDSLMQPFSGIFATFLLPNNHPALSRRLEQVMSTIKLVYASIYSKPARTYFQAVNYKVEEEKMAVVIQEVVGNQYEGYYYPHISGTAQSYNFYPVAHMQPEEGFATCAVGLGQYVVEGEKAYRFSPKYPRLEIHSPKNLHKNSQTEFYAVNMNKQRLKITDFLNRGEEAGLARLQIADAEAHSTLKHCASVYDPDNDRIEAGISAYGPRIVNFANILKYDYIPLAKTIDAMLDVVKEALGSPVEIEFAVDLNKDKNGMAAFYLLQIKPLVGNMQDYNIDIEQVDKSKVLLYTERSMGNGKIQNIVDVVYVDPDKFDKMKTREMAQEIEQINETMLKKNKKYILIGPGRWGTRDRFIGIPVVWSQISNAKIIVEISTKDFVLDASLGSHFFHNVTSMNVGYFTVQASSATDFISWDFLKKQPQTKKYQYFNHIRFKKPLKVIMDGKKRISLISY